MQAHRETSMDAIVVPVSIVNLMIVGIAAYVTSNSLSKQERESTSLVATPSVKKKLTPPPLARSLPRVDTVIHDMKPSWLDRGKLQGRLTDEQLKRQITAEHLINRNGREQYNRGRGQNIQQRNHTTLHPHNPFRPLTTHAAIPIGAPTTPPIGLRIGGVPPHIPTGLVLGRNGNGGRGGRKRRAGGRGRGRAGP